MLRLFSDNLDGASLYFLVGSSRGHQGTDPADYFKFSTQKGMGGQQSGADFITHKRILYIRDRVLCIILTGHWYDVQNEHF
jgi:hypothetical protein